MGYSSIRMAETMATLKVLAEENLQTMKKDFWKDEYDTLQMNDRVKKINDLMKTMLFDWERIPAEWDYEKKVGTQLK